MKSDSVRFAPLATIVLLFVSGTNAFIPTSTNPSTRMSSSGTSTATPKADVFFSSKLEKVLFAKTDDDDDDAQDEAEHKCYNSRRGFIPTIRRKVRKNIKPVSLAFFTASTIATRLLNPYPVNSKFFQPPTCHASAPVTPIKTFKAPDAKEEAFKKIREEKSQQQLQEAMAHQIKCEEIEAEQGKEARKAYEDSYNGAKQKRKEQKVIERKQLQYQLADQGICPFQDIEGVRRMHLFDDGVDLTIIPGTPQQKEAVYMRRSPKMGELRSKQRFLIKCIVDDIKLKGEDPLVHLEVNTEKTAEIFAMKERKVDAIVARYKEIIENQGSLSGIVAETPFNTAAAVASLRPTPTEDPTVTTKEEKARLKAEEKEAKRKLKEAEKEKKAKAKAEAKAHKEAEKAKIKAEKEAAKAEKEAAKAQTELAAAEEEAPVGSIEDMDESSEVEVTQEDLSTNSLTVQPDVEESSTEDKGIIRKIPIVPVVSVVGVTGAGLAFKTMKNNAIAAEEERQRQFKMLMGIDEDDDEEEDDDDEEGEEGEDDLMYFDEEVKTTTSTANKIKPVETPSPIETKKRKRMGISSVFSKKKNSRETDLGQLIAPDSAAPELAVLLAKILTFGAPGRFPDVIKFPGGMPMEEFDQEEAKAMLEKTCSDAGLTDEVAAEMFASVVNCMIIDIIDLASSSLGVKEDKNKVIVEALNVVMEFMDHAAGLFDAVADGVAITPVTYGGTLGKSKLEQMFAIYASSMMSSLDGSVTQDRIDTLQQVFNINDKKAEGLIQKKMMSNLMEMMKNGDGLEGMMEGMGGMEGMEGLSEMMGAMGGEGGLPGMGADGEISPEELKQSVKMMKELVDSGSVSKDDLKLVRKQFEEMYGSDINDLIKEADEEGAAAELGEDGEELLDLFKTILKE